MMNSIKVNYVAVGATLIVVLIMMTKMYYTPRGTLEVSASSQTVCLRELLPASLDLAEAGGSRVVEVKKVHKLNAESKGKTKEGANEMKTDGDMQSHRTILSGFHKSFPMLASRIVSEEHDKEPEQKESFTASKTRPEVADLPAENVNVDDITIWVDPLDATQEYTEDLDQYVTVMVCVAVRGKPVIGVIHRPQKSTEYDRETVWAWVGKGVSQNLGAIKKSDGEPSANPNVIISRSHTGAANEVVEEAFGKGKGKVIPAGGAGYKSIEVLRGKADIYAHVTLIKKWDICAGNALLNAVGGHMRTLTNDDINYDKSGPAANEHGLLASVNNYDYYMKKLGPVFTKSNKQ